MKKPFKMFFASLMLAVAFQATAPAAVVVNFNRPELFSPVSDSGLALPALTTIDGVTTTSLTRTGLGNFTSSTSWPIGRWLGAFDANRYVSFSVTPDPGQAVTFDSIVWDKGFFGGSGGLVASAQLRTNVDNFAGIFTAPTGSLLNDGGDLTYDVSVLGTRTETTEFRFYFVSDGGGSNAGAFSDLAIGPGDTGLTLNGTVVTAIPEPGSFLAIGVVGVAILVRRRSVAKSKSAV